ncbi:Zn2/Cys6 DNA-binding protein [Penicillium cf. viridicatum]|uniref:Zn2/Cys6 DNA-binding protein n=1 Tax=Penicillium cf. viridicatum TaxID=2972119 RepID=A0A9W9MWF3_9EURO|nr:Zn2/Cys6 DNA-binding protein [Penicillium cf. viridicatum]
MSPPHAKRQKLRKGTHSCWECKRRKMKCVFDPLGNTICKPCQIRGSKCVRQEFHEDVWTPHTRTGGGNIDTGQGQTPLTSSEDGKRSSYGIPTPESPILTASASLDFYRSTQVCFKILPPFDCHSYLVQPSPEDRVFSE